MDGSKKVMESFDSLWFFNNVLTLTTLEHKLKAPPAAPALEEEKPSEGAEILVPRSPKCGEIAVGIEQRPVVQSVKDQLEFAKPTEKPERRKRGRRRRRKRSKRKVLGELDLGFYGNKDSESSFSEETYGYQNFESLIYNMKMPPLNDGFAMKEHLKSWAYAVACTVR